MPHKLQQHHSCTLQGLNKSCHFLHKSVWLSACGYIKWTRKRCWLVCDKCIVFSVHHRVSWSHGQYVHLFACQGNLTVSTSQSIRRNLLTVSSLQVSRKNRSSKYYTNFITCCWQLSKWRPLWYKFHWDPSCHYIYSYSNRCCNNYCHSGYKWEFCSQLLTVSVWCCPFADCWVLDDANKCDAIY